MTWLDVLFIRCCGAHSKSKLILKDMMIKYSVRLAGQLNIEHGNIILQCWKYRFWYYLSDSIYYIFSFSKVVWFLNEMMWQMWLGVTWPHWMMPELIYTRIKSSFYMFIIRWKQKQNQNLPINESNQIM